MIIHSRKRTMYSGPWTEARQARLAGRKAGATVAVHHIEIKAPRGLGDVVETIAKPIAIIIDRFTSDLGHRYATRLAAGCSACSKRRKALNRLVRDVRQWREWLTAWRRIKPAWQSLRGCRKPALKGA